MTRNKPPAKKKRWIPPTPVVCICGEIHRTHIETLAPAGTPVPLALDAVEDHQLIALDGTTQICSCGARHNSQIEHLADVALGELEAVAA